MQITSAMSAETTEDKNRFWGCIYDTPVPDYQEPTDQDLTVSEIKKMQFKGLPVRIEHHEGDIGRVIDSKTDELTGRTEVCIELNNDPQAIAARLHIESGVIKQLSLKHLVYANRRMEPEEISLCIQGARLNTDLYSSKKYKCGDMPMTDQPLKVVCCSAAYKPENYIYSTASMSMATQPHQQQMPVQQQQQQQQQQVQQETVQMAAVTNPHHVHSQPRDEVGRFSQEEERAAKKKRTYAELVNDTATELALDNDEKRKAFLDFAVTSAKEKHELEQLNREMSARIEKLVSENKDNLKQAETLVEQVVDAMKKIYGAHAPDQNFDFNEGGQFVNAVKNADPIISRGLAPLVVACSNLIVKTNQTQQKQMASQIEDLNKQLSFYSQSFDTMNGTAGMWKPSEQAAAPVQAMPQYQMQAPPIQVAASALTAQPAAAPRAAWHDDVSNAVSNLKTAMGGFNTTGMGDIRMPLNMLPKQYKSAI